MPTEAARPTRISLLVAAALVGVLAPLAGTFACRRPPGAAPPLALGDRRELFVDDHLIAELRRAELRVHPPTREGLAAVCDAPWEGNGCGYYTVLHDDREQVYRMYYHAWQIPNAAEPGGRRLTIAYRESDDGITWKRPNLGLCEFAGSRDNNILLDTMPDGGECHDFSPFIDSNPAAEPEARYKAIGAGMKHEAGVWGFRSPDGIQWTPLADRPVFSQGMFDSQNVAFWSPVERRYVMYSRVYSGAGFEGTRLVSRAVSDDFLHWRDEGPITFPEGEGPQPLAQFYVSQIRPYDRAPHLFLGFPARYVDHGLTPSTPLLPEWDLREPRMGVNARYGTAVTDSVYITSRDGRRFRQSNDVFLRPGLRTRHNWSYGDNYLAWHVVETRSSRDDEPRELSLYATESYFTGRDSRLRRFSLRIDGFGSVHARSDGGDCWTKPLVFVGDELSLNCATSAAGTIRVAVLTADRSPIPDYGLEACDLVYGDTLDRRVSWRGDASVTRLAGRPVVLHFELREADLYSLKFEPR